MNRLNEIKGLLFSLVRLTRKPKYIYLQIWQNKISIRTVGESGGKCAEERGPFSSSRSLVGDFDLAVETVRKTAFHIAKGNPGVYRWRAVIHPMEMAEGGLSQVEERVLHEVFFSVMDGSEQIHLGSQLSDHEVLALLDKSFRMQTD